MRTRSSIAFMVVASASRISLAQPADQPPAQLDAALGPPGMAPAVVAAPVVPDAPTGPENWLTVGVLGTSTNTTGGVRLQLDVFDASAWSIGVAGSLLERGDAVMGVAVPLASGVVYVARTGALFGPFRLRAQLGVGGELSAQATESSVAASMSLANVVSTSPIVEGALLLSADLGAHWAIVGGPIVTYASAPTTGYDATTYVVLAGLQHR